MKKIFAKFKKPKEESKILTSEARKGFVALFTVLIAAVILSMAVGIASIALKQIVLSASATDANKSFYAADSGIECALYHDIKGLPGNSFEPGGTFSFDCGGSSINVSDTDGTGNFEEFSLQVGPNNEYCAYVSVDKIGVSGTRVVSKGINVPCGEESSRLVERAIQVTY